MKGLKKLGALLLALLVLFAFYLFALMSEDDASKPAPAAAAALPPPATVTGSDGAALLDAFQASFPAPGVIESGSLTPLQAGTQRGLQLTLKGKGVTVTAVRPASLSAALNQFETPLAPTRMLLDGNAVYRTKIGGAWAFVYHTEQAAYLIRTDTADEAVAEQILSALSMYQAPGRQTPPKPVASTEKEKP